jgi:hypothetical protein
MPTIRFIIYQTEGRIITEDILRERPYKYEELFNEYHSCEGALIIVEEGIPGIKLEDELPPMIINLCFSCNAQLKSEEKSIYHFQSYYGQVVLSRRDQKIKIEGEGIPVTLYEMNSFRKELYKCGVRFMDLLKNLKTSNNDDEDARASLINLLENAKKELDLK